MRRLSSRMLSNCLVAQVNASESLRVCSGCVSRHRDTTPKVRRVFSVSGRMENYLVRRSNLCNGPKFSHRL